jgi:hypothetical protein
MNGKPDRPSEQNEGGEEGKWLPPIGIPMWVMCEGYRTMATLDSKGVWRNLANGKVIKGVVKAIKPSG